MTCVIILLISTYLLNVIDYLQTVYIIDNFGLEAELNPIMLALINNEQMWVVKLLLVPLLLVFIGWVIKKINYGTWAAWILAIFYLWLVLHNFRVLWLGGLMM